MLDIKQLQEKLGVSKMTIYNNKPSDMEFIKIDGKNYINEELEKLITNNVKKNRKKFGYENVKEDTTSDNKEAAQSNDNEMVEVLREHIDSLKSELDKKNKQLDYQQKITDQQQRLSIQNNNENEKLKRELEEYKKLYQLEYDKKNDIKSNEDDKLKFENEKLKREVEEYKQMEVNQDHNYKDDVKVDDVTTNDTVEAEESNQKSKSWIRKMFGG